MYGCHSLGFRIESSGLEFRGYVGFRVYAAVAADLRALSHQLKHSVKFSSFWQMNARLDRQLVLAMLAVCACSKLIDECC